MSVLIGLELRKILAEEERLFGGRFLSGLSSDLREEVDNWGTALRRKTEYKSKIKR